MTGRDNSVVPTFPPVMRVIIRSTPTNAYQSTDYIYPQLSPSLFHGDLSQFRDFGEFSSSFYPDSSKQDG